MFSLPKHFDFFILYSISSGDQFFVFFFNLDQWTILKVISVILYKNKIVPLQELFYLEACLI